MGRSGKKWHPLKEKQAKVDDWGWGDSLDDLGPSHPKSHFSLRAEAQNTERRHHQQRSSTPRIRREPVQFVSVGSMTLDQSFKKLQVDITSTPPINLGGLSQGKLMSRLSKQELQPAQSPEVVSHRDQEAEVVRDAGGTTGHTSRALQTQVNQEIFFTDTMGTQQPICTGFPQPIIRSNSPCLSDSSDEVIVFAGRGRAGGASLVNRSFSHYSDRSLQPAHSTKSQRTTIREDPVDAESLSAFRDPGSPVAVREALDVLNHSTRRKKPKQRKAQMKKSQLQVQDLEEEAIADYIANIDPTDGSPKTSDRATNLENENVNETDNTGELTDKPVTIYPQQNDSPRDLETSEDPDGLGVLHVTEILSKRHNLSGIQYLVVEEGSSAALARWISVGSLKSGGAEHHIRTYESKQLIDKAGSTARDDSGSDESESQLAADLQDDFDDLLVEKESWDRQVKGMTDENIARLLSKQEELGLGSSELLLQDGIGNNYGNFDILDLNRPSLQRLPKGGSRLAALDLDDDKEMRNRMQVLWEKDRSKKKIRKQEREELRTQGLLESKNKANPALYMSPDDIKSADDIKGAIRIFLLSSSPRLALPPLSARNRKMVHEIAHVFKLNSKSFGTGGSRYPVLAKTDQFSVYDENVVDALERKFGFRLRKDKGLRNQDPRSRNPRFSGASRFTYQDGDIVGAAAPELGVENKGRAMLEKMGWSKGTALGALNNKGIMQPLAHVVRNSKAGLG